MMDPLVLLPEHHQKQFDSRFRIVLIAAQRAKQMIQGPPTERASKFMKETSQALEEVLRGDVPFLIGSDARQALKEAHSIHEREFAPALLSQPDENAQEIQKELSVYIDDSPKSEEEESEVEESS
jgi:DNA-directed RNA polymerase subunit omega